MLQGRSMSGHGLLCEGAAHLVNQRGQLVRVDPYGVGGYGRGVCRCGAMSDILDSGNQRKAWHRAHKAGLTAEADHYLTDCRCKR